MSMYRPMYNPIPQQDYTNGERMELSGFGHFRGIRLASIPYRILALIVDVLIVYVVWKVFDLVVPERFATLDGLADLIGFCLALGVAFVNFVWLQSRTGQSIGKLLFGMIVVHPFVDPHNVQVHYYSYASVWTMLGRTIVHYFADLFFLVGLLFMAKSPRRESIADWCCNTIVLRPAPADEVEIQRGPVGAKDRW